MLSSRLLGIGYGIGSTATVRQLSPSLGLLKIRGNECHVEQNVLRLMSL